MSFSTSVCALQDSEVRLFHTCTPKYPNHQRNKQIKLIMSAPQKPQATGKLHLYLYKKYGAEQWKPFQRSAK